MPRLRFVSVKATKFGTGGTNVVQVGGSTQNVPCVSRKSLIGRCVVAAKADAEQTNSPRAKTVVTMRRASLAVMAFPFLIGMTGRQYSSGKRKASGDDLTL